MKSAELKDRPQGEAKNGMDFPFLVRDLIHSLFPFPFSPFPFAFHINAQQTRHLHIASK